MDTPRHCHRGLLALDSTHPPDQVVTEADFAAASVAAVSVAAIAAIGLVLAEVSDTKGAAMDSVDNRRRMPPLARVEDGPGASEARTVVVEDTIVVLRGAIESLCGREKAIRNVTDVTMTVTAKVTATGTVIACQTEMEATGIETASLATGMVGETTSGGRGTVRMTGTTTLAPGESSETALFSFFTVQLSFSGGYSCIACLSSLFHKG